VEVNMLICAVVVVVQPASVWIEMYFQHIVRTPATGWVPASMLLVVNAVEE